MDATRASRGSGACAGRPRSVQGLLLGATVLFAAGCSGGGGGAGSGGSAGGGPGVDLGQGSDGSVEEGDVVAEVALDAPQAEDFVLSATLPLPKGIYSDGALSVPLSVQGIDGSATPTQLEVVSRYPNAEDGADVVEVLAHVRRPPGAAPGDRITYKIGVNQHDRKELLLDPLVVDLLEAPGALTLVTQDALGHPYRADLLAQVRAGDQRVEILRDGQVVRQVRTHEVLLPVSEVEGPEGTLPHMFGVHTYVTVYRGEPYFSVDLHVHNGLDGLDAEDPRDDALQKLYFESLLLRVPNGWNVEMAFDNPALGDAYTSGGWSYKPLIEGLAGNKLHVMMKQGQLVRRLVVYKGPAARPRELLQAKYRAFCVEGETPSGAENWSWWNPDTARFLAQNHVLPNLDHIGADNLRAHFASDCANYCNRIASGSSGTYPMAEGAMGWAHVWGVDHGGMAGGDEINIYDGVEAAYAASAHAYRLHELIARAYIDRHPVSLFDVDGEPTQLDDFWAQGPQGPYVDVWYSEIPKNLSDPFGFLDAPTFQNEAVAAAGRRPSYEDALASFAPIDFQHYIRYTRNLKVLIWLGNDAVSKDLMRFAAHNFHLSFHEHPVTSGYQTQFTQLRQRIAFVGEHPGMGVDIRRTESWGVDTAVVAYAVGDDELREKFYPWFELIAETIDQGQSDCTGNIMATEIDALLGGDYLVRQANETAFVENMLWELRTSVFEGRDQGLVNRINDMIVDSVYGTCQPPFWHEEDGAPRFVIGVAPKQNTFDYCWDVPQGAMLDHVNSGTYFSSLAYAYQLTGDEMYLFRAAEMMGGGDLLNALQNDGTWNLRYTAALLAVLQNPGLE